MSRKGYIYFFFSLFLFVQCDHTEEKELKFYISNTGAEGNSGTISSPFPSIAYARDYIRNLDKETLASKKIIVYLRKGVYRVDSTIKFDQRDSGRPNAPLTYMSYPGEKARLVGGYIFDWKNLEKPSEQFLAKMIDSTKRDKVYMIDLGQAGIEETGKIIQHGFSTAILPSQLELFVDHNPMELSRYPNNGRIRISKVYKEGSKPIEEDFSGEKPVIGYDNQRPDLWVNSEDIWLSGYFKAGFADDNIPVESIDSSLNKIVLGMPHMFGVGASDPDSEWGGRIRGYYAYNLPEELDEAGEYFLDRKQNKIYFIAPDNMTNTEIAVSMFESPVLSLKNVSNFILKDLIIEYGRGMGIYMEGGDNNTFDKVEVSNFGTVALMMGKGVSGVDFPIHEFTGALTSETVGNLKAHNYENTAFFNQAGENHTIKNSHFYNLGAGGVVLSGGNRKTLKAGNNIIENCEIHDFNRRYKTYCAGITIFGVGNAVRKSKIYNAPHQGVAIFGNDHLIEYNHLSNLVRDVHDNGAIYIGRNPSERGNIIRYNYFSDNGTEGFKNCAIHIDDHASDVTVFGNVFYNTSRSDFGDILINGGSYNTIENNLFIKGAHSIWVEDPAIAGNPFFKDNNGYKDGGIIHKRLTKDINVYSKVWEEAYPELITQFESENKALLKNEYNNNVVIDSKFIISKHGFDSTIFETFNSNLFLAEDPGFEDYENKDFNLKPNSIVYEKIPDFQYIPFDSIPKIR